jgi:hypothetical protein
VCSSTGASARPWGRPDRPAKTSLVSYPLIEVVPQRGLRKSLRTQRTVASTAAYACVDRVRIGNETVARMNIEQTRIEVAALKPP